MRDRIIIRQVGAALVSGYERLIRREGGDAQGAGEIWAIQLLRLNGGSVRRAARHLRRAADLIDPDLKTDGQGPG